MKKYFLLLCMMPIIVWANNDGFQYLNQQFKYVQDTIIDNSHYKGWFDKSNKPSVIGCYFDDKGLSVGQIDSSGQMNGYINVRFLNQWGYHERLFAGQAKWNKETKKCEPIGWGAQRVDSYFLYCDESKYEQGGFAFGQNADYYITKGIVAENTYQKIIEVIYENNKDKIKKVCQSNGIKYVEDVEVGSFKYCGGWKDGQPYLYGAYYGVASSRYWGAKNVVYHGYFTYKPKNYEFFYDDRFYEEYKYGYKRVSIDVSTGDTIVEEADYDGHTKYILSKEGVKYLEQYKFDNKDDETFYIKVTQNFGNKMHWAIIIDQNEFYEGIVFEWAANRLKFYKGSYGKSYSVDGRFVDCSLPDKKRFYSFANGNVFLSYNSGYHKGINYLYGECLLSNGEYRIGFFNEKDLSIPLYGDSYDKNDNLIKSYVDVSFSDFEKVDEKVTELKELHKTPIIGYGTVKSNNGVYTGDFKYRQRHGIGKFVYSNGDVYEGEWKNNLPNGKGVYTWVGNSLIYEGDYVNGNRHGIGHFKWKDGRTYEGEWKNDKITGDGTLQWPNGHIYKGQWLNNKRHGEGLDSFPDRTWSQGVWEDDEFVSGYGKIILKGDYQYEGMLGKGRVPNKKGTVTHSNGTNYQGYFRKGTLISGNGITVKGGERIEGTFNESGPIDTATVTFIDGTTMAAIWKQNHVDNQCTISTVGDVTIKYSNGMVYIGEIANHFANDSNATISNPSEINYTGGYSNRHFNGEGTYVYANGDSLKAVWNEVGLTLKTNFVYVWSDGRRCEGVIGKNNEFTKGKYYDASGVEVKKKEYKEWQFNPIPDNIEIIVPVASAVCKY